MSLKEMILLAIEEKEIEAIFFDADGTIANSNLGSTKMMIDLAIEMDVTPKATSDEVDGLGYAEKMDAILGYHDPEAIEEAHRRGDSMYPEIAVRFDGADKALAAIKATGVKMAICTSGEMHLLRPVLDGMPVEMDLLQGKEEGIRRKPYPDVYLTAMRKLGVEPHEVLVIEDNPSGIKAATDAGVPQDHIFIHDPYNKKTEGLKSSAKWV